MVGGFRCSWAKLKVLFGIGFLRGDDTLLILQQRWHFIPKLSLDKIF
jgi:hypothetical protein